LAIRSWLSSYGSEWYLSLLAMTSGQGWTWMAEVRTTKLVNSCQKASPRTVLAQSTLVTTRSFPKGLTLLHFIELPQKMGPSLWRTLILFENYLVPRVDEEEEADSHAADPSRMCWRARTAARECVSAGASPCSAAFGQSQAFCPFPPPSVRAYAHTHVDDDIPHTSANTVRHAPGHVAACTQVFLGQGQGDRLTGRMLAFGAIVFF
jgi:hypothetical protein